MCTGAPSRRMHGGWPQSISSLFKYMPNKCAFAAALRQPAADTMKAMEIDTGDSRVEISSDIDTTSLPAL